MTKFNFSVNQLSMATYHLHFLFLVPFACTIIITLASSTPDPKQFIYNGFTKSHLNLIGTSKIDTNGLLQLTNSSQQQKGVTLYQQPIKLSDSPDFSTTFAFAIYPEMPDQGGHGLSFVLSPSRTYFNHTLGDEYLGLFNYSTNGPSSTHLFAVELDTVKTPQFSDINGNHVGVDVNSLTSVDSAPVSYYSEKEERNISLSLMSRKPMQVWIDYDARKTLVNVAIAPLGEPKPKRFLVSSRINLSEVVVDKVYAGFCASTGTLFSSHYILGWSFNQSGEAEELDLSKLPQLPKVEKPKKRVSPPLIGVFAIVSLFLMMCGYAFYVIRRKRYEEVLEEWEKEYGLQRFSYKELYEATKGFKEKELLGSGGFGKVYKGALPSTNAQVAIKKVSHDSRQGMKEFVAEVASMRRLRHRNLVPLLGYCHRKSELLLVYEYMPNGSLDNFLFNKDAQTLSWTQRFMIIKGVGSALLYLHEEWEQVVLHRDVKASNVLLDANMDARLGDFGLARLYDHGTNPQTTHVVGTVGYLAPEISRKGKASTSSNVFAFGVLMLEVACGRRPIETELSPEHMSLVDWVMECWNRGAILAACDPRLQEEYNFAEMELILRLGLLCSQPRPESRPSMRQAMQFLNRDAQLNAVPLKLPETGLPPKGDRRSASFPSPSIDKASNTYLYSRTDSVVTYGRIH